MNKAHKSKQNTSMYSFPFVLKNHRQSSSCVCLLSHHYYYWWTSSSCADDLLSSSLPFSLSISLSISLFPSPYNYNDDDQSRCFLLLPSSCHKLYWLRGKNTNKESSVIKRMSTKNVCIFYAYINLQKRTKSGKGSRMAEIDNEA